jgi:hypothetical protein
VLSRRVFSPNEVSNYSDLQCQTQAKAPFGFKSVSGAVTNLARPPDKRKAAPGRRSPSAAADDEHSKPEGSEIKDSPSAAATQVCRALVREDIAAALYLAIGHAELALGYLESGDDFAVRYLVHRFHLYAEFAAACALDLRRAAS